MSYFRPQQAGKIDPRTIHSFSDSTSLLSQNAGQVIPAKCALFECLKLRVQSRARLLHELHFGFVRRDTVALSLPNGYAAQFIVSNRYAARVVVHKTRRDPDRGASTWPRYSPQSFLVTAIR